MAADLQQCEDERREFMPHRNAGEADAGILARLADRKRRLALVVVAAFHHSHAFRQRRDIVQQCQQFL
jgi:hypothetical protein